MNEPRIGIWICGCMGQISDHIDIARVVESAAELDHVVSVTRVDHLCGRQAGSELQRAMAEHRVDRIIFGGCSARSSLKFPEETLTAVLARNRLDKAFLEVANLREQCAWLHEDEEAATAKAIDLVAMAHARVKSAQRSLPPVKIASKALIIGGGPAGLAAAKSLASAGQPVTLVEKNAYLGGRMCQIGFLFQCEGYGAYCRSECVGPVQARDIVLDDHIEVLTQSEVMAIEKMDGNFQARIKRGAAFVDPDRCISCGKCAEVCPEEIPSAFAEHLEVRKAIDKDFERAVPDTYSIQEQGCTFCGACAEVCPTDAVDLKAKPELFEDTFGAVFMATGNDFLDLKTYDQFCASAANVVTGIEFERIMDRPAVGRPSDGKNPDRIVFALCAGSRATHERMGQGVPYCSKTCCAVTVKQAERVLAKNPMTEVVIIVNQDMRTYERAFEGFYVKLKAMGVEFVNAQIDGVEEAEDQGLKVRLSLAPGQEPYLEDVEIEGDELELPTDLLVLAAAQTPRAVAQPVMDQLGVQRDAQGFPLESQVRLFRPTESLVDRVYAVGASSGPKIIQQSVEQGSLSAMKALPFLMRGEKETLKYASQVDPDHCIRCGTCITVCPHGAIRMTPSGAVSDPAFCQACGFCAAACPTHAAQLMNFTDRQILDQAAVAFDHLAPGQPKILGLLCYWCSYSGGDLAGVKGMKAPANFRSIRIRCSSSVNSGLIMEILRMGVDGVLIAGCPEKNCHHQWGNYLTDRRITLMRALFQEMGMSQTRLRFEYIGVPQSKKFVDTIEQMDADLRALGPNPIPMMERN